MAYKAFVSSTYEDLHEHRAHVILALRKAGIVVDPMEDWTASTDEPKVFSQDRTQDCDLCVLLLALRRGHLPRGETKSIVQLEHEAALAAGVDVLVFLLRAEAPWPHSFDELKTDPALREWRAHLMEQKGVGFFGHDPVSLEIAPALTRWIAERQSSPSGSSQQIGVRSDFMRSPWLGLEIWQTERNCPMVRTTEDYWDSEWGSPVRVYLDEAPFELRLPQLGDEEVISVSAWSDASIFQPLLHRAPVESIPYLRPGTGMADTSFGSGMLILEDEGHHSFGRGFRLVEKPDGAVTILFNQIYERGADGSLGPSWPAEAFMVVHVARPGVTTLELDSFERVILSFGGG